VAVLWNWIQRLPLSYSSQPEASHIILLFCLLFC
jgi:hypothetical protein